MRNVVRRERRRTNAQSNRDKARWLTDLAIAHAVDAVERGRLHTRLRQESTGQRVKTHNLGRYVAPRTAHTRPITNQERSAGPSRQQNPGPSAWASWESASWGNPCPCPCSWMETAQRAPLVTHYPAARAGAVRRAENARKGGGVEGISELPRSRCS